jgi:hypothetical protein
MLCLLSLFHLGTCMVNGHNRDPSPYLSVTVFLTGKSASAWSMLNLKEADLPVRKTVTNRGSRMVHSISVATV